MSTIAEVQPKKKIKYWSPERAFSYNRYLTMVIGARNIGKTYGTKKALVKEFLKSGKQFLYVRRYETHLKHGTVSNFFEKVKDEFPEHEFKVRHGVFYIDGKVCGSALALSKWQQFKGSEFPNVYTIFMDEFLKEDDNSRYIPNEPKALLSLAESVFREKIMNDENVRIICLSNLTTIANPYFIFFKITPDVTKRFNTFSHKKEILVEIPVQQDVIEAKDNSRFGELIKNTPYETVSNKTEFAYDKNDFIMKRTKESKYKFSLELNGFKLGVWVDVERRLMFMSNAYDEGNKFRYVLDKDDFNEHNLLVTNYKNDYHIKKLVSAFQNGLLRFDNVTVKNIAYDMFQKLNIR